MLILKDFGDLSEQREYYSGAKGRRFESCQAYHVFKDLGGTH